MQPVVLLLVVVGTIVVAQSSTTHVYIEERVTKTTGVNVHCDTFGNCCGHNTSTTHNVSLQVTRELVKTVHEVTVTDNRDAADYVLRISPGNSTLSRRNGDVAYISPARFKVSNLAKDVCGYVEAHRQETNSDDSLMMCQRRGRTSWVCEDHPSSPFPHDGCPDCCTPCPECHAPRVWTLRKGRARHAMETRTRGASRPAPPGVRSQFASCQASSFR